MQIRGYPWWGWAILIIWVTLATWGLITHDGPSCSQAQANYYGCPDAEDLR